MVVVKYVNIITSLCNDIQRNVVVGFVSLYLLLQPLSNSYICRELDAPSLYVLLLLGMRYKRHQMWSTKRMQKEGYDVMLFYD